MEYILCLLLSQLSNFRGAVQGMLEHMGVVPASRQDYTWGEPSTVTGEPGDPEVNKSIVSRYAEEVWNQHNLDMLDELMSTDVISHVPIPGTVLTGLEAHKQTIGVYITAFPDLHNTVEDLIAEGDKVAERWTATATHRGGIPPTGKQVAWTGITIYRFADGKIVENWWAWNKLGLMQQLGVIPPLGPQAVESRTWGKVKVGFRR
ncbi:MAG: hypothetical protein DRP95_05430 [Candidatus Latescibacterota bacterium]|nr:MAG: hypothetical protein DRP95_05430 [Candidatus Latescibacterota bacterium]